MVSLGDTGSGQSWRLRKTASPSVLSLTRGGPSGRGGSSTRRAGLRLRVAVRG